MDAHSIYEHFLFNVLIMSDLDYCSSLSSGQSNISFYTLIHDQYAFVYILMHFSYSASVS